MFALPTAMWSRVNRKCLFELPRWHRLLRDRDIAPHAFDGVIFAFARSRAV